jgi:hypothetical protein
MLYNDAEAQQSNLDDAFPTLPTTLTRLAREEGTTTDDNAYRVTVDLAAPIGSEELGQLLEACVPGVEFTLEVPPGGIGATCTAVYQ